MTRTSPNRLRSLILYALASVLSLSPQVWARSPRGRGAGAGAAPTQTPQARANQLLGQGVLALATRDFAAAYRALSEAYRLVPVPDTLFQLGVVAWGEGRSVPAQDVLRRYLADPGAATSGDKRAEAERIVAQLADDVGEVSVVGPEGAFVIVDDRLVGRLPLPLPLLMAKGAHTLLLDAAGGPQPTPQPTPISIDGGARLAVQVGAAGLAVRPLHKVLWQARTGDGAPDLRATRVALGPSLLDLDLALLPSERTGRGAADACDVGCALSLARTQGAVLVVRVSPIESTSAQARAEPAAAVPSPPVPTAPVPAQTGESGPSRAMLTVEVIDVAVGAAAATGRVAMPAASTAEPAGSGGPGPLDALMALVPDLLRQARGRGHGTLHITSQPPAEVWMAGVRVGTTPYDQLHFVGPVDVELRGPGWQTERRRVEVVADQRADWAVQMTPLPPPAPVAVGPQREPRPRLRLALGGVAVGVGGGLVALGISALAVSGQCIEGAVPPVMACPRLYDTTPTGATLLAGGAALTAAGVLLLAWPGPRRSPAAVAAKKGD